MIQYCLKIEIFIDMIIFKYDNVNNNRLTKMQTKKSLFIELLGDSPTIRILDFLLTERELDFSISDMARNAGIGRATLYRIWEELIKNEIIIFTRTIGKSKLYRLNVQNPKIKKLIEIDDMLIIEELRNKAEKQRHKIKVTV